MYRELCITLTKVGAAHTANKSGGFGGCEGCAGCVKGVEGVEGVLDAQPRVDGQEAYCGPVSIGIGCILCFFCFPAGLCVICCPCDSKITTYRNGVPITTM